MRHERAIPSLNQFEIRSAGKAHRLEGYAAMFGAESLPMPYIETVAPGAFRRSLALPPNGRQTLVVDHDDVKLLAATTGEPALRMVEDNTGLLVDGEIADTQAARDLRELSDRKLLSGMSFEFSASAGGAPFSADRRIRTLNEVRLYHVTVLTGKTPAYLQTTAAVRSLAEQVGAGYEDMGSLFEAIHEGRRLAPEEWSLMKRVIPTIVPRDSRWSSAADDAANATCALGMVLGLLGEEADDAAQSGFLKAAAAALQSFIASEADEIGTPEDVAESGMGDMADMARARPNLDAARALLGAR